MFGLSGIVLLSLICSALSFPIRIFNRQTQTGVPQYVLDYAPLVWLDREERFFPSDIAAQITNTYPTLNATAVAGAPSPLTLDNVNELNNMGDKNVYLTSNDDFSQSPPWLQGVKPDGNGKTGNAMTSAIVVRDRGKGVVDAFYFYFYAYNQGNTVFGQELGNHVGDWEHNMIRFKNSAPTQIWYSQHANGAAFMWNAVEKKDKKRPIAYSAKGSHATYATPGTHDHTIPNLSGPIGFLTDVTSRGTLWDPVKSAYLYTVTFPADAPENDSSKPTFTACQTGQAATTPVNWLYFSGRWGDNTLPDDDARQQDFFSFHKYEGGPTGPFDKQLNRKQVCPENGNLCIVRPFLWPGS